MMTSYFNLLKYAATGIASYDMTYYDCMRASTLMGGVVQTLTGQTPLSFKADGTPLISWSIKGNGQQQGTPTPDAPIQPTFCGVRTAQLFNKDARDTDNGYVFGSYLKNDGSEYASSTYRISEYIPVTAGISYTLVYGNSLNAPSLCFYDASKDFLQGMKYNNRTIVTETAPNGAAYMRISYGGELSDSVMLNSGSTALPYEPFGYKIPITCAGQTVPVYLGQTQTVRSVRKLVLTGEEDIAHPSTDVFRFNVTNYLRELTNRPYCTHYVGITPVSAVSGLSDKCVAFLVSASGNNYMYIRDSSYSSVEAFKQFLTEQYAAGTPVTVWYVLAEPETAIVNEPLCKIGDYADELHSTDAGVSIPTVKGDNTLTVDTELQPSEMTITYRG